MACAGPYQFVYRLMVSLERVPFNVFQAEGVPEEFLRKRSES